MKTARFSEVEIKYSESSEAVIIQSIKQVKDELSQPNIFIGFECSYPLHNLAYLLKIEGFEQEGLKRQIIFKIINAHRDIADKPINDFYKLLCQEISEYKSRDKQEFHVLIPINISENIFPSMSALRIKKIDLEFYSWEKVKNQYQINTLIEKNNYELHNTFQLEYLIQKTTPIVCRIHENNSYSAYGLVQDVVELLRSILNYYSDDIFKIQLGYPEPLGAIRKTGHYGVFSSSGILLDSFADNSNHLLNINRELRTISVTDIKNFINQLNSNTTLSNLLIGALKLYCSALDTTDFSSAYLSLWQCIELLTMLSNRKYGMDDVVDRTQILIKSKSIVTKQFLNLCADRRNNLVHKGIYDSESQSNVQLLKLVAKYCIKNFIKISKQYKDTKDIEHFYAISRYDQKELKSIKKIVDSIYKE